MRDKIIEILRKPKSFYGISCDCDPAYCTCTEDYMVEKKADEILALHEAEVHRRIKNLKRNLSDNPLQERRSTGEPITLYCTECGYSTLPSGWCGECHWYYGKPSAVPPSDSSPDEIPTLTGRQLTAEEWNNILGRPVHDPDGWPRNNPEEFQRLWYDTPMVWFEFQQRAMASTCMFWPDKVKLVKLGLDKA